ncbi:MAG TPA: response regulator transcription factor [Sedimentisphaerales bacterium]|nr:response regulator transcription factor [Sedimentisphaerales bacterium]
MDIRILIADDHKMVREAITSLLNNEIGMSVVAEAADGRTAVQLARELQPDVVIMDITMPNLNGIEATRQILHEPSSTKVVLLSEQSDRRCVCEALRAGASGFLPKRCGFDELITAIRNLAANHTYLSPEITGVVVEGYINRLPEQDSSAYSVLTNREREVLQLIAEGVSTKNIAKELYLSAKTIEWHRSQLMKKLHLKSVADLVKYAINEGLTCAYV